MLSTANNQASWGVDHTNVASGRGRNSIRLTSKASYTHGLVVLDLAHMPGGACGIWPAFWMTGPNWPNSGEIDIIEGVGKNTENQMTMHTNDGCSLAGGSCQGNSGCFQRGGPYADTLNGQNGGIYAMEWTSDAIRIFFFSHGSAPADINSDSPNPSNWGNPVGTFQGGSSCTIDDHFMNHNIVFDTTFCGDWAGGVWSQDGSCASQANSCQDYVQNNPGAYSEAYWTVNSLKVYTTDGQSSPAPANVDAAPVVAPSSVAVQSPSPSPTSQPLTPPLPSAPVAPKPAPAPVAPKQAPAPSSPSQPAAGSKSTDGPMALRVAPDGTISLGPVEKKKRHHARHLALHTLKHGYHQHLEKV